MTGERDLETEGADDLPRDESPVLPAVGPVSSTKPPAVQLEALGLDRSNNASLLVLAALVSGITMSPAIATSVGVTRQHVHRILRRLVRHGLAEKRLEDGQPTYWAKHSCLVVEDRLLAARAGLRLDF